MGLVTKRLTPRDILSRTACIAARGALGLSQSDLAAAANVAQSTLADFERGSRNPHWRNLLAIREQLEKGGVRFSRVGRKWNLLLPEGNRD